MLAKCQTILQLMEQIAPKRLALPEDRIGLQAGSVRQDVRRVMVALDVTEEVVEEAVAQGADMIVAHHAIIYRPLRTLVLDNPSGRLMQLLLKHDLAVYIAHTNLDTAEGGVNDILARSLGLRDTAVLAEHASDRLLKLVVFVPEDAAERVFRAVCDNGGGAIGDYSHCTFQVPGTGTFLPGPDTSPHIGKPGQLQRVPEVRLETIVREQDSRRIVQAMLKAHPYEEPAYDLYPTELTGKPFGLGRVGRLERPLTLRELAETVKKAWNVPALRAVGDLDAQVSKVAVLGGSGSGFMAKALLHGADVYITGDVDYHTALDARAAGLSILDPGHNVEKLLKQAVADRLNAALSDGNYETDAFASAVDTEPFIFL